jgi:hypothetical protein
MFLILVNIVKIVTLNVLLVNKLDIIVLYVLKIENMHLFVIAQWDSMTDKKLYVHLVVNNVTPV